MVEDLSLLHEKERQTPGSVRYSIRRYRKHTQWDTEDVGMISYNYKKSEPSENSLELKFCITGNMYCNGKSYECGECKAGMSKTAWQKKKRLMYCILLF